MSKNISNVSPIPSEQVLKPCCYLSLSVCPCGPQLSTQTGRRRCSNCDSSLCFVFALLLLYFFFHLFYNTIDVLFLICSLLCARSQVEGGKKCEIMKGRILSEKSCTPPVAESELGPVIPDEASGTLIFVRSVF